MVKRTIFWGCALAALAIAAAPPEQLTLVHNRKADFRIVTPDRTTRELKQGIDDLAALTREATGARVAIVPESKLSGQPDNLVNLHVGLTDYVRKLHLDLPRPYGFLIYFVDDKNLVIAGVRAEGADFNTIDGIYCFLETFLGIRFLMPGELGTHVPPHEGDWVVPCRDIREVPDCFVRKLGGVHGQAYERKERLQQAGSFAWALRSGVTPGAFLNLNHNVGNLIDPVKYAKTHPEFFPLIDGQRRIPPEIPGDSQWRLRNWEPCYTANGIAEEAAKNIIEFFDRNPDSYSCSLSVNDSGNICQCDRCRAGNRKLPAGSESQSYYEWVAKVTKLVKQKYPDRYFGLLNYWVTKEMPENIKLDPHVVPIVCEDLKFYVAPDLDAKLEQRLAKWDQTASTIGWWDYGFEGAYMVPAFNAHYLAAKLKHLYHKHNLRVYTDELHPGRYWKNAPQNYMVLKLLRNIDRDPDELLDEWYSLAVGKEAAPYLKQYFAIWEKFWTEKIPRTDWFRRRAELGAPFLQRRDGSYLDALEYQDVKDSLELLNRCVAAAPPGKPRQRAEFFRDYFAMAADQYLVPYLNGRKLASDRAPQTLKPILQYPFDRDFQQWKPWQSAGHTAKLTHDPANGHQAPGCLKLDRAKSLPTGMTFFRRPLDFKLEPGKNYRLSAWCKAEHVEDRSRARMVVYFPCKTGGVLGQLPGSAARLNYAAELRPNVLKDGQWHEMVLYVAVPPTAWSEVVGVDCQLEYETEAPDGCCYFDDFTVAEVTSPVPGLLPEFGQTAPKAAEAVFTDPETGETLGPELLVDGDMEASGVEFWRDTYTPKVKAKSSEFKHGGQQSLHLVADGSGDGVHQIMAPFFYEELFQVPRKALQKDKTYRVQLWVKNVDPAGTQAIRLPGTPLKTPLKADHGDWQKFVFRVPCNAPESTDYLVIGYGSLKSDVYIDDVSVREILSPGKTAAGAAGQR